MKLKREEKTLTKDEKLVMVKLKEKHDSEGKGAWVPDKRLSEGTGFDLDKATGIALDLSEYKEEEKVPGYDKDKRLVEAKKVPTVNGYRLTDTGRNYVENGFPEKRILTEVLKKSPKAGLEISEVLGSVQDASPGIGQLKKKGWASIKDGIIVPTETGVKSVEEEVERSLEERILRYIAKQIDKPDKPQLVSDRDIAEDLDKNLSEVRRVLGELERRKTVEHSSKGEYRSGEDMSTPDTWSFRITEKGLKFLDEAEVVEEANRLTSEMLVEGSWRDVEFREYDVSADAEESFPGKVHPYRRLLEEMRQIFVSMGFEEIKSPTVESGFWNFDALFQPQDHPAREMQDTFYLSEPESLELPPGDRVDAVRAVHEDGGDTGSTGWGGVWREEKAERALLRTHTTAATIRHLFENPEPPAKVFCIDRAYRRETIDATHLPQFYQLEGIVMDEDVSFKNLLGCLETFYSEMGFTDVRFRPAYFPYTEPSVEPEVYVDELGEWVELGGAGVFREEVTSPAGVEQPVLAWGLGAGRLAMLRLGLTDLRDLYLSDVDWLREEPICR